MRAYKFLDDTHRGVFSGFRWPVPGPGEEAGPWVEAGVVAPCREGIHGCRPSGLGFWLNDDLWEIELDGDVVEIGTKVVASRGRLRRRIGEWAGGVRRELIGVAAFRARDTAVAFCRNGSVPEPAAPASGPGSAPLDAAAAAALDALAACRDVAGLRELAVAAYRALPEDSEERTSVGFLVDAVHFLDRHVCHTPYVAACAAGHAASARTGRRPDWEAAVNAERAWQSAWIADRLSLA